MNILSRRNYLFCDENNTIKRKKHLYESEIQKVNNKIQIKYSRAHLEKEKMPTKEKENKLFLTNADFFLKNK